MKQTLSAIFAITLLASALFNRAAEGYTMDFTVPDSGGCPQPNHRNISASFPQSRQWSTSLPTNPNTILTVAANGTFAQLHEIESAILDSFGAWTGVAGSILNSLTNPNALGPLTRTAAQDACENDSASNADGINTICFNLSSSGFTTGVLAFTRTIVATAPGQSVGSSGPAAFAGQILDADIYFRPDGQAMFATPSALSTSQGQGSYDLESLLMHELGHSWGLDHTDIRRAVMFPFAPSPGTFLGDRPTPQAPDGPLSDDDRTGLRFLYPDPNDAINVGTISGRILPANPFAISVAPSPSPGNSITGIFGAYVVAVDADSGAVVAGALGGWSCNAANPPAHFDGTYSISRLPLNRNYKVYVAPLDGLTLAGDVASVTSSLCRSSVPTPCTPPQVNTNFTTRVRPPSQ
ncbi:MAG: matrixin family metalloprotease [Candidatus Acidiferrales bacterium]